MTGLPLSPKYIAFLRHNAPVEMLEGTTYAGKTTVGVFKFMLKVAESSQKLHILAAEDTGTAEKNLISKDLGITACFGGLVEYNGNGTSEYKMPHIIYHTDKGDKVIYVLGYGDKRKWKKALGGQYGCLYVDEINTADMAFVSEAAMRCDYFMGTLNPDDPNLPVYDKYINCCRPLPEYANDAPPEINAMLANVPAKTGWTHWFFTFADNAGASPEKIEQIKTNTPKGTKLWKNKIQGLRGKATGLVFSLFNRQQHVVSRDYAKRFVQDKKQYDQTEYYTKFSAGLDTAYSTKSPDTIAMSFIGITNKGNLYVLDERVYNNADLDTPIAPSDTVVNFVAFLERNRKEWGFAKNTFVDSADQATLTEFAKYKRKHPECLYIFNNAYKKVQIIDRIYLQLGWLSAEGKEPSYFVVDTCTQYIGELEIYSWKEDKDNEPEDGNDHMVNSVQYAWLPSRGKIGVIGNGVN